MAGITLAQAEAQLAKYLDAETKVLSGQAVEVDGRRMTRADLAAIQAGITTWDARCKTLGASAGGRGRAVSVAPKW